MAGDGQVTLGQEILKATAHKVRRLYNVGGGVSESALSQLAIEHGIDSFILWFEGDVEAQLRRFAAEVAPAVRQNVAQARG